MNIKPTIQTLLSVCALCVGLPAIALAGAQAKSTKPNFVVIFIDDLGYGDIGPFGATKQATPNLDRMASEGMKLTSFYAAPVCSVSRAQLMTGCYGARVSVPGVFSPGNTNGLHPAERTIADYLKEQGYATACVGKWHLGDQPEFLPTRQGFDRYFGIPYSNDMQRQALGGTERVSPLVRDEKVVELLTDEQQSRIVERYTAEATGFIRDNKDRPFFLYLPHTAVHTPIWPGDAFRGKSANGRFGDWVQEVDWSVGQILSTLRELQLDDNTLVLFTSDNGPWLIKGADGGSAGPLRGGKGSTWEGGVRVPTLARWPGKIPAGSVCDSVAGTIDVLPTVVALAGGTLPAEPIIDGRNLMPLLMGQSRQSAREAHYYFAGYNLQAVRQGPWKLALVAQPETMGRGAESDVAVNPRLYNLDQEIGERTNLAAQHPEIVARLQRLAERMSAEIGGKDPQARRPPGVVTDAKTLYPTEPAKPAKGKAAKGKGAAGKRAELGSLQLGDTLSGEDAPQVQGHPFSIAVDIETQQQDTIIVAHGGLSSGYGLALRGGHVVFMIRTGTDSTAEVVSPSALEGKTQIRAELSRDARLSLSINGKEVARGQASSMLTRQPQEDFCVGHDNQRPVFSSAPPNAFRGTLSNLKLTVP